MIKNTPPASSPRLRLLFWGACLLAIILLSSALSAPGMAQTTPARIVQDDLIVTRLDATTLRLELTVADAAFATTTVDGHAYQTVTIPGLVAEARAGAPHLPQRGVLLGVPATDGVRLTLVETEQREVALDHPLLPAPRPVDLDALAFDKQDNAAPAVQLATAPDPAIYDSATRYPGAPAAIAETGQMRDQAFVKVAFNPVQLLPAKQVAEVYARIVVDVSWPAYSAESQPQGVASPAYEELLADTLLNYAWLVRPDTAWHAGEAVPPLPRAATSTTPPLKLYIDQAGLYQLDTDYLTQAGWSVGDIDPRNIQLHRRGQQIPIIVNGAADGRFDAGDTIWFYGQKYEDIYTDNNVYRLTVGSAPGLRMSTIDGAPGSAPQATEFPTTLHAEQNTYYWNTMPDGEGQDHFFWGDRLSSIGGGLDKQRDYFIPLYNISETATAATIRVQLKGYTDLGHRSRIYLNGVEIDDQSWEGQLIFEHEIDIAHSMLNDGNNTVTVEAAPSDAIVDYFLVNWIEVDYVDTYVAEGSMLQFTPPAAGSWRYAVSGFFEPAIVLLDVTDPYAPQHIVSGAVAEDDGLYTLTFEHDGSADTRYHAATNSFPKLPYDVEIDVPSNWRDASNSADYIIITYGGFVDAAEELAAWRAQDGLRTVVVDIEDVYDEFNDGFFSPEAIRTFLAHAYAEWQPPAPTYVLLLGDAFQDFKNNLASTTRNYVPSMMIESDDYGQVASDNWLVAFLGDDVIPEMFVGRLSAETADQAQTMVDKVIAYDRTQGAFPWSRQALFVADDQTTVFEAISEQLIALLPDAFSESRVYASQYPGGGAVDDVIDAVNRGVTLVNYTGHGAADRWGSYTTDSGSEVIFDDDDVAALTNGDRLAFWTAANCLNGFFTGLSEYSAIAETLQRHPDGAALAVWAATSLGYPSGHRELLRNYYNALFEDGQQALGVGTTTAKIETYAQSTFWAEMIETFVLFGDPASELEWTGSATFMPLVRTP